MANSADTKLYYSIKEVSEMLEEPESTLRFWEHEFSEVINPSRKDKVRGVVKLSQKERKEAKISHKKLGIRFYSETDVDDVRLIKYLIRDCRLNLEGVRIRLKNNMGSAEKQAKISLRLNNIKAELQALSEAMDEAIQFTTLSS